jgi:hypothetical protein
LSVLSVVKPGSVPTESIFNLAAKALGLSTDPELVHRLLLVIGTVISSDSKLLKDQTRQSTLLLAFKALTTVGGDIGSVVQEVIDELLEAIPSS